MQILRRFVLGLGLVLVVPLGGHSAFAARTEAPAARKTATTKKPLVRRIFDPSFKKALPESYTIGDNTYVSATEYADLAGGVMELLKRYPPNKYFFVGLGRDPAPVIAFLQNLGEKDLAVNLPGTSNIGWADRVALGAVVVKKHIEAAIPESILKGNRQIVILDVTSSGKTPAIFGPYIDHYLKARGINKTTIKLGFSDQNIMQGSYGTQLTDEIDTTKFADFQAYPWGKYEGGVSEHVRHEMGTNVLPPKETRVEYKQFRNALRDRMKKDKKLDSFLVRNHMIGSAKELAEWTKVEKEEAAKQAEIDKVENAKRLVELQATAKKATAKLGKLVASMKQREESHGKGPYLSENGETLDKWLQESLASLTAVAEEVPSLGQSPNAITTVFMAEIEKARAGNKIRQRDYRRLMGHAIAASTMDAPLIAQMKTLYKTNPAFKKEIMEETDYFLTYGGKGKREGLANMEENFRTMMATVSPRKKL